MFYPQKEIRYCDTCGINMGMQYRFRHYCPDCAKQRKRDSETASRHLRSERFAHLRTYRLYNRYTPEEEQYIINNYGTAWLTDMAEHLGRDYNHLCSKIYKMKLQGKLPRQAHTRFA